MVTPTLRLHYNSNSDLQTENSFTFIQSRSYIISSWEVETTHRVAALESAASEKS